MAPIEHLFWYEVEFHRKLRTELPAIHDYSGLHTSYALGLGYEPILRTLGTVSIQEIERVVRKLTLVGDIRDVLRARDSMLRVLKVHQFEGYESGLPA